MNRATAIIAKTLALLAITLLQVDQIFATHCCCRDRGEQRTAVSGHNCCGGAGPIFCGPTKQSCCHGREGNAKPCQCPAGCCSTTNATLAVDSEGCTLNEDELSAPVAWVSYVSVDVSSLTRFLPTSSSASAASGLSRCIMLCCFRL